jgi:hypothetical protein
VEHRAPSLVARGRGVLCRRDDVGEQHGAQGAMGLRRRGMAAGEKLLDSGQDPVGIGEPVGVVHAVDLQVSRARNVIGEVPSALHRNAWVLAGMDDEAWRGDRRQDRPNVDPERRFDCRPCHPRAGAHPLQHCELA